MKRLFLIIAILAGVVSLDTFFTVTPIEQVLIVRFGEFRRAVTEPGLQMKWPFIEKKIIFDKRILEVDLPPERIITADKKRLVVDTYTRYKIVNPLLFYQRLNTEYQGISKIGAIISSTLRSVLGKVRFDELLSSQRSHIMTRVQDHVSEACVRFGVSIIDVRIRRADLPPQNSEAIYNRMRSERDRIAKTLRAEGNERAHVIRASADKEKAIILAEAQKKSEISRGQGDKKAARIYGEAFSKDVGFYEFYRAMKAYREGLASDTTFVIGPGDSAFLEAFGTGK